VAIINIKLIAKICLATGCRWGEAQSLNRRHIRSGKITFTDTKSGKNRAVPISKALEAEIGGNILTLQRILGHSSITMTMRYAHLAPDHLQEAIHLNPLECGRYVDTDKINKSQLIDFKRK